MKSIPLRSLTHAKAQAMVLPGLLGVICLYIAIRLHKSYRHGGDEWRQGDWLINRHLAEVRRGPIGSMLLDLSDATGLAVLPMLIALQVGLVLLVAFLFWRLLRRISPPAIAWTFVASAGSLPAFWAFQQHAAGRKEAIAFVGLLLVSLAVLKARSGMLLLGSLVLCIAFFGHEATTLFTPAYLGILWLGGAFRDQRRLALSLAALVCLAALIAGLYAVRYDSASLGELCRPLIERGLKHTMCKGALHWLAQDVSYARTMLSEALAQFNPPGFLLAYAIGMIPFAFLIRNSADPKLATLILLVSALPFLPLYFIAVDWGRWMHFHVFSATLLLVVAHLSGRLSILRAPRPAVLYPLIVVGFLSAPHIIMDIAFMQLAEKLAE